MGKSPSTRTSRTSPTSRSRWRRCSTATRSSTTSRPTARRRPSLSGPVERQGHGRPEHLQRRPGLGLRHAAGAMHHVRRVRQRAELQLPGQRQLHRERDAGRQQQGVEQHLHRDRVQQHRQPAGHRRGAASARTSVRRRPAASCPRTSRASAPRAPTRHERAQDFGAHIQSIKVSTNLGREQLFELGRRGPYHRYVSSRSRSRRDIEIISTAGDQRDGPGGATSNLTNRTIIIDHDDSTVVDLGTKNKLASVTYGGGQRRPERRQRDRDVQLHELQRPDRHAPAGPVRAVTRGRCSIPRGRQGAGPARS
jgi:hypothetical protein